MANLQSLGTATAGVPDSAWTLNPATPIPPSMRSKNSRTSQIENQTEARPTVKRLIRSGAVATESSPFRIAIFSFWTRAAPKSHNADKPDNPKATMIGKKQLNWLKEGIRKSKSDFIFVVSSVNFMVPHVGSGGGKDKQTAIRRTTHGLSSSGTGGVD